MTHTGALACGLVHGWGETPGSPERASAEADAPIHALLMRVLLNYLDSIHAAIMLAQLDSTALPPNVLLGAHYAPDAVETVTLH